MKLDQPRDRWITAGGNLDPGLQFTLTADEARSAEGSRFQPRSQPRPRGCGSPLRPMKLDLRRDPDFNRGRNLGPGLCFTMAADEAGSTEGLADRSREVSKRLSKLTKSPQRPSRRIFASQTIKTRFGHTHTHTRAHINK